MFIVYSKKTGNIKNVVMGGKYNELKDLFPYDFEDYIEIYSTLILEDDLFVQKNSDFYKIVDEKLVIKDEIKNKLGN